MVMECFGRLGEAGKRTLAALRRQDCDFGRRRPGTAAPVGLNLRAMRTAVEAAVIREVADTALLALGCRSTEACGWKAANVAASGPNELSSAGGLAQSGA